jgi:4-hydroxy-tetrahydrodipicolinate synthase
MEGLTMAFQALGAGVWQILPTPFTGRERAVDRDALRRIVAHAQGVGVTGLVALGVLGEASRLSSDERSSVLETVVGAAGSLPVVAGAFPLATAPAAEEARRAAAAGAAAVMLLIPSSDGDRVAEHMQAVSNACGLGVVFQDHPATTGVSIAPAALVRAVTSAEVGVAVKAEAPPTPATVSAVAGQGGLPVFGGLGGVGLLDELAAGAAGAMTGFAFPEALVRTVEAYSSGGFAAAKAALEPYLPVMVFEAQVPVSLAIRKEILRRRGLLADGAVRPPGVGLPPWAGPILDAHLEALGDYVVASLPDTSEVRA